RRSESRSNAAVIQVTIDRRRDGAAGGYGVGGQGTASVVPVASFVPLPSASYENVAWFEIVVPAAALIVATIVIVATPSAAIAPFHVTVFVSIDTVAVPPAATALTSVKPAGSTSTSSLPA